MNPARLIPHKAIQASAGSGKTYQLAHRYIRLLAGGIAPDTIVALTFSRKAAGEILTDVVKYLSEAAASPEAAARHARDMDFPGFTAEQFRSCLRAMADSLHRLHVGTLDSFIVNILRSFALELGLGSDIQIMDDEGADAEEIRRKIRASVFASPALDDKARRQFREAIRQATFGREEKRLGSVLDRVIRDYWPCLREAPEAASWGQPDRIWPAGVPWQPVNSDRLHAAAESLRSSIEAAGWDKRLKEGLIKFIDFASEYTPLSQWNSGAIGASAVTKIIVGLSAGATDGLEIEYNRKVCRFNARQAGELRILVSHLFGTELQRALSETQGLYQFVSLFDQLYDRLARRRGALTFQDAQYLLTPANALTKGASLSRDPAALLYVDYRLDCRLNHWLLDEFQDTSDLQWAVLANLAHEILQDSTGERSFFYVGDVKQSIYGWRGGNPRLFDQVRAPYPAEWIGLDKRSVSYRSCEAVISTVNRVFERLPEEIPEVVCDRWRAAWENHSTAPGRKKTDGVVALIEPLRGRDDEKPTEEDRYRVAARLLQEADPLGRGLTVAALVRSNASGKALANVLRQECPGWMIVHEGPASIRDNPVVELLLSLVKFAVHPADMFAWRHLQMSPLQAVFRKGGLEKASLPMVLLRQIHGQGIEEFVRTWGDALACVTALSDFERKRLADLVAAAASFDQRGERDGDAFLRFMDRHEINEPAAENAVRVMTVHQAKGLEFDMVILPDLQPGRGGDMTKSDPEVLAGPAGGDKSPPWLLAAPRRILVENDAVLGAVLDRENADSCYEELCVLYVAMTRAKRGLYIVTSDPGQTSKAFTPAVFLKKQLAGISSQGAAGTAGPEGLALPDRFHASGRAAASSPRRPLSGHEEKGGGAPDEGTARVLFSIGSWGWFRSAQMPEAEKTAGAPGWPADFSSRVARRKTLNRVEPSGREARERKGAWFFSAEARDVLDFGSAIHELFQQVTWAEEVDPAALAAAWLAKAACAPEVQRDAVEQFKRAMQAPELRAALARPAGGAELWREKRFDLVDGRNWVTGTFDRVVIERDERGRILRAGIADYKSDRIGAESDIRRAVETYRGQMELYRTALQRILGCKTSDISVRLLFTRAGRAVAV